MPLSCPPPGTSVVLAPGLPSTTLPSLPTPPLLADRCRAGHYRPRWADRCRAVPHRPHPRWPIVAATRPPPPLPPGRPRPPGRHRADIMWTSGCHQVAPTDTARPIATGLIAPTATGLIAPTATGDATHAAIIGGDRRQAVPHRPGAGPIATNSGATRPPPTTTHPYHHHHRHRRHRPTHENLRGPGHRAEPDTAGDDSTATTADDRHWADLGHQVATRPIVVGPPPPPPPARSLSNRSPPGTSAAPTAGPTPATGGATRPIAAGVVPTAPAAGPTRPPG
jgi:hypothetical protein